MNQNSVKPTVEAFDDPPLKFDLISFFHQDVSKTADNLAWEKIFVANRLENGSKFKTEGISSKRVELDDEQIGDFQFSVTR